MEKGRTDLIEMLEAQASPEQPEWVLPANFDVAHVQHLLEEMGVKDAQQLATDAQSVWLIYPEVQGNHDALSSRLELSDSGITGERQRAAAGVLKSLALLELVENEDDFSADEEKNAEITDDAEPQPTDQQSSSRSHKKHRKVTSQGRQRTKVGKVDTRKLFPPPENVKWGMDAYCFNEGYDPEIFVADNMTPEEESEAVKICGNCDARADCLAFALSMNEGHGIWGGKTPDERLAIRRRAIAQEEQRLKREAAQKEARNSDKNVTVSARQGRQKKS
jgi:hypothetical protein